MLCRLPRDLPGTLPPQLASLTKLEVFQAKETRLNGTIPSSYFSAWASLQSFTIESASINGTLPAPFLCVNLTEYMVLDTPVTAPPNQLWVFDSSVSSLTKLVYLGFGECLMDCIGWHSSYCSL
jgi:hypothetical protein